MRTSGGAPEMVTAALTSVLRTSTEMSAAAPITFKNVRATLSIVAIALICSSKSTASAFSRNASRTFSSNANVTSSCPFSTAWKYSVRIQSLMCWMSFLIVCIVTTGMRRSCPSSSSLRLSFSVRSLIRFVISRADAPPRHNVATTRRRSITCGTFDPKSRYRNSSVGTRTSRRFDPL